MANLAKAVMLVAAAAVLFALVCPVAATPSPVGGVKRISDAVAPIVVPLLLVADSPQLTDAAFAATSPTPAPLEVFDVSCILIC